MVVVYGHAFHLKIEYTLVNAYNYIGVLCKGCDILNKMSFAKSNTKLNVICFDLKINKVSSCQLLLVINNLTFLLFKSLFVFFCPEQSVDSRHDKYHSRVSGCIQRPKN